ncbi:MAG: hypothetical protein J6Z43_03000 [Clostridiales bacterium]|nr:hypothetical protein [Clostridiales bacterium]
MADWSSLADTYKCPGCTGNLFYNTDTRTLNCKFCGNSYAPDVFEMLEVFGKVEEEPDAKDDDARHEIVCSSCGAVVITDENTSSSICCYCGSPALAARRLTKEFRPDYIIPFVVTKDEARAKFLEWAKSNKYIPNDFTKKENIDKLTGIYVPFWLVDCKCEAEFYGTGYMNQGKDRATFALERFMTFYLSRVPFDGSRKISDRLMAAVEPFDYSEMKEYKDSYLPGFFAERYDQKPLELSEKVSNRMRRYAEEAIKMLSCGQYDAVSFSQGYSNASDFKHSYALLPVWFMNYQYNGVNFGFAINGQTGEACGDLPFDPKKRTLALAKTVLLYLVLPILFLLALTIGLLVISAQTPHNADTLSTVISILPYAWVAFIALFLGRFAVKWTKVSNESQNPIDPPPKVEQYYDGSKKPDIEKKDKFVSVMPRVKDDDNDGNALVMIFRKFYGK